MEQEKNEKKENLSDKEIAALVDEKLKNLASSETKEIITKTLVNHREMFEDLSK